jgi:hypothetical protein
MERLRERIICLGRRSYMLYYDAIMTPVIEVKSSRSRTWMTSLSICMLDMLKGSEKTKSKVIIVEVNSLQVQVRFAIF